jgi:hypothetical protein
VVRYSLGAYFYATGESPTGSYPPVLTDRQVSNPSHTKHIGSDHGLTVAYRTLLQEVSIVNATGSLIDSFGILSEGWH